MSLLLLLACLAAASLGPTGVPTVIDLPGAVEVAQTASPAALRAHLAFEQAVQAADRERPRLRPDLTFAARTDAANRVRDPAQPHALVRRGLSAEVALTARQLLWHWGGRALSRRAAAAAAAAEADYHAALAQIRLDTALAWLDLWSAQDGYRLADEGVNRATAQVQRVEDLRTIEKATEVDQLQAEAGVLEARAARAEAATGVKLAEATLNRWLGAADLDRPLSLPSPGVPPTDWPPLAPAIAWAQAHRPEVLALELRITEAQAGLAFARADRLPTLAVTGELAARTPSAFEPSVDVGIGLELNWPLSRTDDATGRMGHQADDAVALATLALDELRSGLALEVRSAYRDHELGVEKLALAEGRVAATTEAHRIKALQYERERATLLELNDALFERNRAEADAARARADLFRAAARFEKAVGKPLSAFVSVDAPGE